MTTTHLKEPVSTCLATYGTLAPGRPNHHQLEGLAGHWRQGTVRGTLLEAGWGAALGYPGLVLDLSGDIIEVSIFESSDLPDHWQRLDDFEGNGYQRTTTQVATCDGDIEASIYIVRP